MISVAADPVAAAFREEWGRVVAALIRRVGDWDLAEECAAGAFEEASRRWPTEGVPDRPGAWLTTVAGNRALDRLRRTHRGEQLLEQVGRDPSFISVSEGADAASSIFDPDEVIEDDRLRLIFTCCHPALSLEARVGLTLRMLGGLSTAEIARAFLVEPAAMARRLTRAKAKIAGAGIPFRVPSAELLAERVSGVLAVLYLMFNEGYLASSGAVLVRAELCEEAIRLTRLVAELLPAEGEPPGLLALMLLHHARRMARVDGDGELVPLEEQDRGRWDRAGIIEGQRALSAALGRGAAGPYALQAAIVACHVAPRGAELTDWDQIAALYARLVQIMDTPVVRLSHAVAVAMAGELSTGLAMLDALSAEGSLAGYHLLAASRARLLDRAGEAAEAAHWYALALVQAPADGPEQRFLARQLRRVDPEAERLLTEDPHRLGT